MRTRCVAVRIAAQRLFQLSNELALLGAELDRRFNHDAAEEIAARSAAHGFDALVLQAKDPARLRLRRNLDGDLAVERRHEDRAAERRGRKAHRYLAAQVLAVALEYRVLAHLHFDIQVARRAAIPARLALARQAYAIAGVDARRHFHRELARAAHAALAEAGVAGIAHDRAAAATART